MIDLTKLVTETRNPNTMDLDQMTPLELVTRYATKKTSTWLLA